jgi:hypothetical protein
MSSKNTPCAGFSLGLGRIPAVRRAFAALAFGITVLALLVTANRALAAGPGNFSIKTPSVDEKTGEWHIKVRIDLPRAPGMMHTPMRFTFSKEAVDERSIMSKGAEPVHHRMVIDTPPKQIVGMDVDFADASGKVFKSTYFEFDLQRRNGYFEAGEYLCSLSGPDGEVGVAQKLTLKGDNPPVYRGEMNFAGGSDSKKQKGPKIENVSNGIDGGTEVAQNDTSGPSAAPQSTDVAASGSAPDMIGQGAYSKTPEEEAVHEHPSGCGCVAAGLGGGSAAGAAALAGLALAVASRRRRS